MDLEHAEDLLRQGRYPEAIDRFRELLSRDPDRAELRGRVAEAYRLSGNQERAFHHFHRAATLFLKGRDLLGAARMLEAANQVSPNEPEVLFRLAEVLKRLGKDRPLQVILRNLVKAATAAGDRRRLWALEELVSLVPHELDPQVDLAVTLAEVGRTTEAIARWKELASHLAKRGYDFTPRLMRVAELAPDKPAVGVQVSQLLLRYGRAREALAALVPFYEKFPEEVEVLEALLSALVAMDARDKILPARLELLKARTRLGQRGVALEEIKALLAALPHEPRVLEVSAHACAAFGLVGEACRLWIELAEVYDRHGLESERDRVVLLILKTDPAHRGALALAARVLRKGGRISEAESLERRLEDLLDSDQDSMAEVAEVEFGSWAEPTAGERQTARATEVIHEVDVLDVTRELSDVFDTHTPAGATQAGSNPFAQPEARGGGAKHRDPFFDPVRDVPREAPEAPEESTFPMDAVKSAELEALRAELDEDDDVTATDLARFEAWGAGPGRAPRADDWAHGPTEAARPARGRLVTDLLEELQRRKP
ncbi:MAG: tetratricopeptide repeat protein [Deltaproteobacteria bacterium]|nr:tetratricopeptide repeat protein [Deltaproteobacteria bacterium]